MTHPVVTALAFLLREKGAYATTTGLAAGLGRTTVPRWLNGSQVPSVEALDAVLRVHGYQLAVVPITASCSDLTPLAPEP